MNDKDKKGYNDEPLTCPNCLLGKVKPTRNANVGECDNCRKKWNWGALRKKLKHIEMLNNTEGKTIPGDFKYPLGD